MWKAVVEKWLVALVLPENLLEMLFAKLHSIYGKPETLGWDKKSVFYRVFQVILVHGNIWNPLE